MRVHAWGADNNETAVWFFIGGGYVVRYYVRPQPHVIHFYGPMLRSLAESTALHWTSEAENAGLRVGWGFYTAEIDEDVFVAALDAVNEGADPDLLDDVLDMLFDGQVEKMPNEPRNLSVI